LQDETVGRAGNSQGNIFENYICIAKKDGIVNGYSDGNFYPDNPISVAEAIKVISNGYGYTNQDSGPEGDIFKPFIDALSDRSAIPGEIIDKEDNLTRGQMAEMVYRLEAGVTDKPSKTYDEICNKTTTGSYQTHTYDEAYVTYGTPKASINLGEEAEYSYKIENTTSKDRHYKINSTVFSQNNNGSYNLYVPSTEDSDVCVILSGEVLICEFDLMPAESKTITFMGTPEHALTTTGSFSLFIDGSDYGVSPYLYTNVEVL
jgi:hypothetical protein